MNIGCNAFIAALLTTALITLLFVISANFYLLTSPAHSRTLPLVVPTPLTTEHNTANCSSRGGPGVRLNNGRCASWHDVEQLSTRRTR